jgi:hypothetical protein
VQTDEVSQPGDPQHFETIAQNQAHLRMVDVPSCIADTPGGDHDPYVEYMTFDYPTAFLGSSHFDDAMLMFDIDSFANYGGTTPTTSIFPLTASEEPVE